jgi:acid phosphatase
MQSLEPRVLLSSTLPRYDHVVVVVEENHSYRTIFPFEPAPGSILQPIRIPTVPHLSADDAPYIRKLARFGVSFTNAHAETHPSQPNYMVLFSGGTQNVRQDTVPSKPITAPSVGGEMLSAGLSFVGYSESLPSVGFTGIKVGRYARKHAPWVSFTDVPAQDNRPFSDFPEGDFSKLPSLSMVVPNQVHDMHSAPVKRADDWLKRNLGAYAKWSVSHNSLLIVTWDEGSGGNHIPTIFFGARLRHHRQAGLRVDHFRLLRTIESLFRLPALGGSAESAPIRNVFVPRHGHHASTTPSAAPDLAASQPVGPGRFSDQPIVPESTGADVWSALEMGSDGFDSGGFRGGVRSEKMT